jgi:hypothetical protein
MWMRMKRRKTLLLPPRGEGEEEEEQPLKGDSQVQNQRKIYHTSNAMCVESLDTLPVSALKPRRALVEKGKERR